MIVRKFGVVLGLLAVLAGCGGDDTASDTTPATMRDTAPATDSDDATSEIETADSAEPAADLATTDQPADAAVAASPCELVTADEVEAATGVAVVAVGPDPVLPNSCVFGFGLSAELFVETGDRPEFLYTSYMDLVEDGTAELIPDVGVTAVYSGSFRGLAVDTGGGRFLSVFVSGGYPEELADSRGVLVALASAAAARL